MHDEEAERSRWEPLVAKLERVARDGAVLLDVDGTLAPIVSRPEEAAVPARTRRSLDRLSRRFGLVACVSGRPALEVRRLIGTDGVLLIGTHGFERLEPGSESPRADPAVAGHEHDVERFLGPHAEELEEWGMRLEPKGALWAVHWRGAADEAAAEERAVLLAGEARERGLVARLGRKVLELRPIAGVDKGTSVTRLVREAGVRGALYAGDDETDLDAFRALAELRQDGELDVAVRVGVASAEQPEGLEEHTDALVEGTDGVASLLERLAG